MTASLNPVIGGPLITNKESCRARHQGIVRLIEIQGSTKTATITVVIGLTRLINIITSRWTQAAPSQV